MESHFRRYTRLSTLGMLDKAVILSGAALVGSSGTGFEKIQRRSKRA